MIRPLEVKARRDYKIWLRYEDGSAGEIDLSYHVGRGVFKAWEEPGVFEAVRVIENGNVAWGDSDELEFCPNDLYMRLTGKALHDINSYSITKKVGIT